MDKISQLIDNVCFASVFIVSCTATISKMHTPMGSTLAAKNSYFDKKASRICLGKALVAATKKRALAAIGWGSRWYYSQ